MPSKLNTPGVYIVEKNAFPNSAVAVGTAIPVFIGYTQKAEQDGKSLKMIPTRIASFAEYIKLFGHGFSPKFKLTMVEEGKTNGAKNAATFKLNGKEFLLQPNNTLYFYNCIRLFYANGGNECYILSVGTYENNVDGIEVKADDFVGSNDPNKDVFKILEREAEPTLIVIPDIVAKGDDAYKLYQQVLLHCAKTQNRFGIFDVLQSAAQTPDEDIARLRTAIGTTALNYGAAYYPWLHTSIIPPSEIDFNNLDESVDLADLLPEKKETVREMLSKKTALQKLHDGKKDKESKEWMDADQKSIDSNFQQSLLAISFTYKQLMVAIRSSLNLLPPAAAIAGIFTLTDNLRGVWKAPANVSVAMVNEPSINISQEQQEQMNVDATTGKSINVIRPFPGIGTLVWGARTLDGNSQDWKYINVRRTMIMIEQSLKLAARAYVLEPNDSGTWITIQSMMNNFLVNLWKQGALVGSTPEQAYDVQVGLGQTMTPTDILDGILRVSVKVAVLRPAEFIVITFQQLQRQT